MILDINIFQATAQTSQLNYITSKTMELAVGDSSHDYWNVIISLSSHGLLILGKTITVVLPLLMTAKDIQENQHILRSPNNKISMIIQKL